MVEPAITWGSSLFYRLMMKQPEKQAATPPDRRLDHQHASAWSQDAGGLPKEDKRKLEMVQHIDHDDVRRRSRRKWEPLRVRHAVEPRRALNVRADDVAQALLQISDSAADLDRHA